MLTVPNEVARMIMIKKMHPVEAWRIYFGFSAKKLASMISDLTEDDIKKIESTNQHLKPSIQEKLALAFGIHKEALNVRFLCDNEVKNFQNRFI